MGENLIEEIGISEELIRNESNWCLSKAEEIENMYQEVFEKINLEKQKKLEEENEKKRLQEEQKLVDENSQNLDNNEEKNRTNSGKYFRATS